MNVPVRPTPALQKKVEMVRESQQASVLLEINWKLLKLIDSSGRGKTILPQCLPLNWLFSMQCWSVLLGCHIFGHHCFFLREIKVCITSAWGSLLLEESKDPVLETVLSPLKVGMHINSLPSQDPGTQLKGLAGKHAA